MENAHLAQQVAQLKGRLIAADFAIKMLIGHLPDLQAFQDHWQQVAPAAMDVAIDNSSSTCTQRSAAAALHDYAQAIAAELLQRR
jgi:hypothetical protein